jgi:hypothetical protein
MAAPTSSINLTINPEEAASLLQLLELSLGETRVEVHRTHTPDFRTQVLAQESLLRNLIEKLKQGMAGK